MTPIAWLGCAIDPEGTWIAASVPSTGLSTFRSPMKAIGAGFCSLSLRVVWAPAETFHWITPSGNDAGTMMSLWYGWPVDRSVRENQKGLAFRSYRFASALSDVINPQ